MRRVQSLLNWQNRLKYYYVCSVSHWRCVSISLVRTLFREIIDRNLMLIRPSLYISL